MEVVDIGTCFVVLSSSLLLLLLFLCLFLLFWVFLLFLFLFVRRGEFFYINTAVEPMVNYDDDTLDALHLSHMFCAAPKK